MNISFVTKSGNSSERHMLEHLMFYRSEKYPEAASFYNYIYKKNITIDFKTVYDYMETSFYNVNKDDMQEIRDVFNSFYFTESDFLLEQRVILIESENYNYGKTLLEKNLIFNDYENVCDKQVFKNITFEDVLYFKNNFIFTEYVYDDVKNYFSTDQVYNNVEILKVGEKEIEGNLSFSFKKDAHLYELSDILHKCLFFSKATFGINRIFTLSESTLIFYGCKNKKQLENILSDGLLCSFDDAYELFVSESVPNGVQFTLKDFINIKNILKKEEVRVFLEKLIIEICK